MDSLLNLHNILNIVGTLLNCLTDAVPRSTYMILVLGPYIYRAVGIGGGTGGRAPPPNNLHKYAVLLITKVCHFKKNYVCPPNL